MEREQFIVSNNNKKKQKSISFTKRDSATLLKRYDYKLVLTLLQEVANEAYNWKLNWNKLVEKTSTGISSAREYQMIWRHVAYGHPLIGGIFQDDAPLLDDDSDLECEREALPSIDNQTSLQGAACVEVMIASLPKSQGTRSSSVIEAPLAIDVPILGSFTDPSGSLRPSSFIEDTNITFPVTVHRETRTSANGSSSTRVVNTNGSSSVNDNTSSINKNKRKGWSEEEDRQLLAAVKEWGEGNWTNMAVRVPIQRTASQLSKRWSILRKRSGGPK